MKIISINRFKEPTNNLIVNKPKSKGELPPIRQLAKNAARSIGQEIKARINKVPPISQEEIDRRIGICKGCEFFTPNIPTLPEHQRKQERCVKCGCYMNFKAKLRSQHCPMGKW
jgi:hypothetical protein